MIQRDQCYGTKHKTYLPLLLCICALIVLMAALPVLNIDTQRALLIEGGPVETITVVAYAGCILFILLSWSWGAIRRRWYFTAVLFLFLCRELDLDKSQFTVGLLKSRQYIGDAVAVPEKILSLCLIFFILAVVVLIVLKETRGFFSGVWRCLPSELAVFSGLSLIFISKSMDGLGRKLADLNIVISQSVENFAYVVEEVGELGIPVTFAAAIATSRVRKGRPTKIP